MEQFSTLLNEGRKHSDASQHAKAETCFKEALKIKPQEYSLEKEIDVNFELACSMFMQNKFAEAEDQYELISRLIKEDEKLQYMMGICYMQLGSTLGKLGRFIEARDYLNEALKIIIASPENRESLDDPKNPVDPEINRNVAVIYHNLAELMYFLCDEEEEKRYRTIAKNIDLTLETIKVAEDKAKKEMDEKEKKKKMEFTKYIIRGYVKPCAEADMRRKEDVPVYSLTADIRGYCLIINNKFKGDKTRVGSEIDEANVSNVFKQLKFKVIIEEDLSAKDIKENVSKLVDQPEIDKHEAFVLVIMSHGQENFIIIGNDGESVGQLDILSILYAAKRLRGRPKLVFIQACKGDAVSVNNYEKNEKEIPHKDVKEDNVDAVDASQDGISLDVNASIENQPKRYDTVNCCTMDASINGCAAYRFADKGSPFIFCFVKALYEFSHKKHIEEIFDEVQAMMRNDGVEQEPGIKKFAAGKKLYLCV